MKRLDVSEYYSRLTAVGIGSVAKELLASRVTQETASSLACDCPHHDSQSKRSLNVSLHEGLWHCFGCGVGGDVLQLVEFVLYGSVTKGSKGAMPDSHREARDWLAERAGLPPLFGSGFDVEQIERMEAERAEAEKVFSALTELAGFYHEALVDRPDVVEWIQKKYGISRETIDILRIGWADEPDAFAKVVERCPDRISLASTGAFSFDGENNAFPFFNGRVVFPYWSRGRVVYMIGRRTPWTDDANRFEKAKYKKLPTHNEKNRTFVSRSIDNSVLWGEDILSDRPKRVLVTEGLTDGIAGRDLGFPTIALAMAHIADKDIERLVRMLRSAGVETVYFVQDVEVSGVGLEAALKTSKILRREGLNCLIATLDPGPVQTEAIDQLREVVGSEVFDSLTALPVKERHAALRSASSGDLSDGDLERLLATAKIDLCQWRVDGGKSKDLEQLLEQAREPLDVAIERAPVIVGNTSRQVEVLQGLLADISSEGATHQSELLKRLKDRTGLSLRDLRSEVKGAAKEAAKHPERNGSVVPTAEPGSCREVVERLALEARANGNSVPWEKIAEEVYAWFREQGARFFRERDGSPYMFFENQVWPMSSGGGGEKRRYEGMMYRHTGSVPTATGSRTMYAVLAALASDRGETRSQFPWIHTDVARLKIYFNLNNDRHEIAEVSPSGVKILPNGVNESGVILKGDPKVRPITFMPEAEASNMGRMLADKIGRYLACDGEASMTLLLWTSCLTLLEFAGTKPMVRLEGPPGCGKTMAAKMITTLIYGSEEQKRSTEAANFADASRNPLVALDNVEGKDATPALLDFLLTAVTGITREKRAGGSDTATVSERPLCLIMSTGVEPLGGELEEVLSRSVVIKFERDRKSERFIEGNVLAQIREHRDEIFSAMLKRTSQILGLMAEGAHADAVAGLRKSLGDHPKSRCDEFFALMYLQLVAAAGEGKRTGMLNDTIPGFAESIRALDRTTARVAVEASPIVASMMGVFIHLRAIEKHGDNLGLNTGTSVGSTTNRIIEASQSLLFLAMRTVSRNRNTPFPYKSAAQFGVRFDASIEMLREQGFEVDIVRNERGTTLYTIGYDPDRGLATRAGPMQEITLNA